MVNITAANLSAAGLPSLPANKPTGYLELVTLFDDPMPIGVVVSKAGRIFIGFPRLVDDVEFTVYVTNYENNAILRRLSVDPQPVLLDQG